MSLLEEDSTKTMQQLLNEINQVQNDAKATLQAFERSYTSREVVATDRGRLVQGRRQIQNLNERITNLREQMDAMAHKSDPNWPIETFDQAKENALQSLSKLSNQLNQIDKRQLEQASDSDAQSIVSSSVSIVHENTEGTEALISNLPFDDTKKPTSSAPTGQTASSHSSSDEESVDTLSDRRPEPSRPFQERNRSEILSDDSDEDDMNDDYQLENELHNEKRLDNHLRKPDNRDHQSRTSTRLQLNKSPPTIKVHSLSTPLSKKTSVPSTSNVPAESEEDDDGDGELKRLDEISENDEDNSTTVNANVQELRMGTYLPGTPFRVLHNFDALQSGDLIIRKDEILILIEQQPDDWWLFKNPQTQQQGMVPINHIQLQSKSSSHRSHPRMTPVTSASTLVDAFKTNNYIPSGFIASELAPLTEENQYKLSSTLIPRMTESNLTFSDLYWRYDTDQIRTQQVEYQKILTIKKCVKIPKVNHQQLRVLNRCIRLCLYDGSEIISNIHSSRVRLSSKTNADDLTEDWYFVTSNEKTFIDEQSQFLLRSNKYDRSTPLYLLIELAQLCQSNISQDKCDIGCGWMMISLDNDNQSLVVSNTTKYNEHLHGGHFHEANVLLNSQYRTFHSRGIVGVIDRYKQARIRFSLESREEYNDKLFNNLPLTSMIVPINLVQILVVYRNELAYQLRKRYHSNGLSTRPLDSIFLSTFYQALEQPDLIHTLQRLWRHRKKVMDSEVDREEFIKIYELSIYPLLFYRLLPTYDFHNIVSINQRKKFISEMINKQLNKQKHRQPDILTILLDPNLTDKWTPFTTDEICFTLQTYVHQFTSKAIIP